MRNMRHRLGKLESGTIAALEECPGPPTVLVDVGDNVPADAKRCSLCGAVHVLCIDEQVVAPGVATETGDRQP